MHRPHYGVQIPKYSDGRMWRPQTYPEMILLGLQGTIMFYGVTPAIRKKADKEHARKKRHRKSRR